MFYSGYSTSRTVVRLVSIILTVSLLMCWPRQLQFLPIKVAAQGQTVTFDRSASNSATYAATTTAPIRGSISQILTMVVTT